MRKPWEVIAELEAGNGRLYKELIVHREALVNNQEFFAGCRLALDSMTTFGVKQVPEKTDTTGDGLGWESTSELCRQLSTRQDTGHAARDLIEAAMAMATPDEWNSWVRRILIKDLRCGVSEKTINKTVFRYLAVNWRTTAPTMKAKSQDVNLLKLSWMAFVLSLLSTPLVVWISIAVMARNW